MSKVAEKAGLERTHLYRKLKQLNIRFSRRTGETPPSRRAPGATPREQFHSRQAPDVRPGGRRHRRRLRRHRHQPLYTLREAFHGPHALPLTPVNVLGVLSVIFWALVIVVTFKYVTLVLRADNNGEGGVLALTALVSRGLEGQPRRRWWLVGFGIFGAAMFYGDGMITPAISVLSAVEGSRSWRRDCTRSSCRRRSPFSSRCSRSSAMAPAASARCSVP
jgi:hypothetical protein